MTLPLIKAVARPDHLTARAQVRDAARPWFEIRNADSPDEAEMLIYDEVGGWWGTTPDSVVEELRAVTSPNLRVRINSPGGSVFDGVAIANALRLHPANVTVQIDGLAASIASVIAMAGDRVVMTPQSQMMIHDASGLCMGNEAETREWADVLGSISDTIAAVYAERGGGEPAEWRAVMRAEKWYTPQQAVDAGLADEVVSPDRQDKASQDPGGDEPGMRAVEPTLVAATAEETPTEETPAEAPAEPAAEPDTPAEPDTDAPDPLSGAAAWTAAIAGLLQPAPSTVDELLKALLQKGKA